jgi:diguanylate cyclase (GGDEF)-like protein
MRTRSLLNLVKPDTHESNLGAEHSTVTDIETARGHRRRVDDTVHRDIHAGMAELRRTLAATELRFAAALRELNRMRRRHKLRQQEAVSLAEAVAKAQRFAYHDELTGLPNRRSLLDHFDLAAASAARYDQQAALLFLDLDRFKHVNDTFGHSVGDKLLQQFARRLVGCLRGSDTACRYGGDEFVVLLPELSVSNGAIVAAENIRACLAIPYFIDGDEITVTISIGIATYPTDADEYNDLLQVADRAMYRDKARTPAVPSISGTTPVTLSARTKSSHTANRL